MSACGTDYKRRITMEIIEDIEKRKESLKEEIEKLKVETAELGKFVKSCEKKSGMVGFFNVCQFISIIIAVIFIVLGFASSAFMFIPVAPLAVIFVICMITSDKVGRILTSKEFITKRDLFESKNVLLNRKIEMLEKLERKQNKE